MLRVTGSADAQSSSASYGEGLKSCEATLAASLLGVESRSDHHFRCLETSR